MSPAPARLGVVGLGAIVVLAASFAACDAHVEPLDEATQPVLDSDSAGPPATEGAWAECQPSPDDTSGWARTVCPDPGPNGEQWTCSASYTAERQEDDSMWCEVTALCNYECATDADCPTPQSGDVAPVCNNVCYLPCDGDSTCPDGMACHHEDHGDGPKDAQGYCRYVYHCD